jgi:hypothetical protein
VNAFLQGFTHDEPGHWVYVELWSRDMDKIKNFCKYVEEQVNDPMRYKLYKEVRDVE